MRGKLRPEWKQISTRVVLLSAPEWEAGRSRVEIHHHPTENFPPFGKDHAGSPKKCIAIGAYSKVYSLLRAKENGRREIIIPYVRWL
ncbi:MAG: hypothetical protein J6V54_06005 [Bacteroidales bacterium]|nr:hypothetical protein [Bacteroidales bacterium]